MDKVAGLTVNDWLKSQIASEPYFHRMELPGGLVTPGWNDPKVEKLPYFGLPDNMTGMRVLDIGHAEGFYSFEAERRGAGTLLMQTAMCENTGDQPMAEFHPFGVKSGLPDNPSYDPICLWFPNPACCIGMLEHVGFKEVKRISRSAPVGGVFTAKAALQAKGKRVVEETLPWS